MITFSDPNDSSPKEPLTALYHHRQHIQSCLMIVVTEGPPVLMVDGLAPEPPAVVIIRFSLVCHTSINKIRCKSSNYF